MTRKGIVRLLFVLWLLADPVRAQSGEPVGIILSSQDTVKVVRGGTELYLNLADLLYAGDTVEAPSEVTIMFCPLQEKLMLAAGSALAIGSESVQALRGSPPGRLQMSSCVLPQVAFGSENVRVMAGLRARGLPKFPVFLGGKVSNSHPTFAWSAVEDAESFQLRLSDGMGVVVWEKTTDDLHLVHPRDAAPLEGDFVWRVDALKDGKPFAGEQASLTIEPTAVDTEIEEPLLRAVSLENQGYFAEAADYYRGLLQSSPNDRRLLQRLEWLYWQAGLITAANEVRKRLEARP